MYRYILTMFPLTIKNNRLFSTHCSRGSLILFFEDSDSAKEEYGP